ncbi:hypothetical protein AZE42_04420 [Rhizopogon vesiculosus]|uniref:Uncharacterized protein n=1 Tax=Rhizopogon vesiculosus TaxID=180088 RepID=A0A1J8PEX9_9AGAM|nr:hypothetical protein AZE42_04420 [Rhizopogon vesiculosus]
MAGIERRGFAAAARAAMFIGMNTSLAMDSRRAHAPKHLDIDATMNHVMRGECCFFR